MIKPELQAGRLKEKAPRKVRRDIKASKNHSRAQERTIAKAYVDAGFPEARRVPASGAFRTLPGDVDPGELFLVEAKLTRGGRFSVVPKIVDQIRRQAHEMGRPFWALHIWVAEGEGPYGEKLVCLSEVHFMELLRRLRAAEAELSA